MHPFMCLLFSSSAGILHPQQSEYKNFLNDCPVSSAADEKWLPCYGKHAPMLWKNAENGFHGVEDFRKLASMVWKNGENGFHAMENGKNGDSSERGAKKGFCGRGRRGKMGGTKANLQMRQVMDIDGTLERGNG
jgi:hypothetical protein